MNHGPRTTLLFPDANATKPSKQVCGLCGKDPADGYAGIDGVRYCHGDEEDLTCYMRAQWSDFGPTNVEIYGAGVK